MQSHNWDSDGVQGGPSSMKVLLRWLRVPGNAAAWLNSAGNKGGTRSELLSEIHDVLLRHGLVHRTRESVVSKLWKLQKDLDQAEQWLKTKGLQQFDADKATERAVLQICPRYREVAPLLQTTEMTSYRTKEMQYESSEGGSDESEVWDDRRGGSTLRSYSTQPLSNNADFTNSRWDADGLKGRPSSLDVMLKWILTPGNAARWQEAARMADGSRFELAGEVYDLLLIHGITHRTRRGAETKFYTLEEQFDKAENWLKSQGLANYRASIEAERAVLRMCPVYPKIEPVLRAARQSSTVTRSQAKHGEAMNIAFKQVNHDPEAIQAPGPKRGRTEHYWQPAKRVIREDAGGIAVLEPEPEERREFFKLELQVKRDQAICVRAKVRKELVDMGISREDVDRLLPL